MNPSFFYDPYSGDAYRGAQGHHPGEQAYEGEMDADEPVEAPTQLPPMRWTEGGGMTDLQGTPAPVSPKYVHIERYLGERLLGWKAVTRLDENLGHLVTFPVAISANSVVVLAPLSAFKDAADATVTLACRLSQCGKVEALHTRVSKHGREVRVRVSFSNPEEAQRAMALPGDQRRYDLTNPTLQFRILDAEFVRMQWALVKEIDLTRYRVLALGAAEGAAEARRLYAQAMCMPVNRQLPRAPPPPSLRPMDDFNDTAVKISSTSPTLWPHLDEEGQSSRRTQ